MDVKSMACAHSSLIIAMHFTPLSGALCLKEHMKIRLKFINTSFVGLFSGLLGAGVWVVEHQRIPSVFIENPSYAFALHITIAIVLGTLMRFFPAGIFDEDEIRTFNTLSLVKTVKWKDVIKTKRLNFPFIKYVLIYTESSKWALWVPISITEENKLLKTMANSKYPVVQSIVKT